LVDGVIDRFREFGADRVEVRPGVAEDVNFPLPKTLAD
jgi:hypothetical protein